MKFWELIVFLFTPPRLPITISFIALGFTSVNATFSIINVILTRRRFVKVREIESKFITDLKHPKGLKIFEIDVLSYGASVWDMNAEIELKFPITKKFADEGYIHIFTIKLYPFAGQPNPLVAGQSVRLNSEDDPNALNRGGAMFGYISKYVSKIPKKNIRLNIYSGNNSNTRVLLKSISTYELRFKLDFFLNGKSGFKRSWLRTKWAMFWINRDIKKSQKFNKWLEEAGGKEGVNK